MKNLIVILLGILLFTACKKDENLNPFQGTSWAAIDKTYSKTLMFGGSNFDMAVKYSNNNEVIISSNGSYSVDEGTATMYFDNSIFAIHTAEINRNILYLKNTSTGKIYSYGRR